MRALAGNELRSERRRRDGWTACAGHEVLGVLHLAGVMLLMLLRV